MNELKGSSFLLSTIGLEKYIESFQNARITNGNLMMKLTDEDLQVLGVTDEKERDLILQLSGTRNSPRGKWEIPLREYTIIVQNASKHLRHMQKLLEDMQKNKNIGRITLYDYNLCKDGPTALTVLDSLLSSCIIQCKIMENNLYRDDTTGMIPYFISKDGTKLTEQGKRMLQHKKKLNAWAVAIVGIPTLLLMIGFIFKT